MWIVVARKSVIAKTIAGNAFGIIMKTEWTSLGNVILNESIKAYKTRPV